jgi:hypothetical protein
MPELETLSEEELAGLIAPVDVDDFRIEETNRPDRMMRNSRSFNAVIRQRSTVCSLLAAVRFKLLGLGRKDYGRATGIDRNTIKAIERKDHEHTLHWRYTTIHNLIRHWEEQPEIITPAHIQAVINAILGDRRESIEGLFFESEYRFGQGTMKRDGRITPGAVRAFRDTPYVPPFAPLQKIAQSAEERGKPMDIERMQRIWSSEARKILTEKRDVPASLAELHVQAEMKGSDLLSSRKMLRHTRVSAATQISRFAMPPWNEAEPVASQLIAADNIGALEQQWGKDLARESRRPDFHTQVREAQTERGFSDLKMKRILGVEGTRPFVLMRDPVIEGKSDANTEAPPAVLAHIVGRTPRETERLIEIFRENRSLWRKRMGYPTYDNPVRLDREQWGITNGDLSEALSAKHSKKDTDIWGDALPAVQALRSERRKWPQRVLMLAENGQANLSIASSPDAKREESLQEHLRTVINHLGMQRARAAIERRDSYIAPHSVTEAMTRMAEEAADARGAHKPREYGPLHRLAKNHDPESNDMSIKAYCSGFHIRRYADGIEVPSLPVLKHILNAGGVSDPKVLQDLRDEWADRFSLQLQGKIQVPKDIAAQYPKLHAVPKWIRKPKAHPALSSAMLHCIGRVGTSMSRFARDRMASSNGADTLTQTIKKIDQLSAGTNIGNDINRHMAEILLAADITKGTPQWVWIHMLQAHRQQPLPAFRAWRRKLPKVARTPWNLPGLTKADIETLEKRE